MSQMNHFFKLLLGVAVSGMLVLGRPSVALAHEGELHLTEGFVLTPLTVTIFGGAIGVLFLTGFLLWAWASRSLKRKEAEKRQLQSAGSNVMTSESNDIRQDR